MAARPAVHCGWAVGKLLKDSHTKQRQPFSKGPCNLQYCNISPWHDWLLTSEILVKADFHLQIELPCFCLLPLPFTQLQLFTWNTLFYFYMDALLETPPKQAWSFYPPIACWDVYVTSQQALPQYFSATLVHAHRTSPMHAQDHCRSMPAYGYWQRSASSRDYPSLFPGSEEETTPLKRISRLNTTCSSGRTDHVNRPSCSGGYTLWLVVLSILFVSIYYSFNLLKKIILR